MTVELGLLQPSDWTAQWIGPDEAVVPAPGERPGYALHTTFTLDAAPDSARTYATAHGIYELFLNGQRVGDQQLTPGSTSYHTTLQVQTYDVTALLHPAATRSVPSSPTAGTAALSGTRATPTCTGRTRRFWRSWRCSPEQGGRVIGTDASWSVSPTEIVSADLMAGQRVDFRVPEGRGTQVQRRRRTPLQL